MNEPPTIYNEPCDCPPDYCAAFCDPPEHCINRLRGEVVTRHCPKCCRSPGSATWHHNGVCLSCKRRNESAVKPPG